MRALAAVPQPHLFQSPRNDETVLRLFCQEIVQRSDRSEKLAVLEHPPDHGGNFTGWNIGDLPCKVDGFRSRNSITHAYPSRWPGCESTCPQVSRQGPPRNYPQVSTNGPS